VGCDDVLTDWRFRNLSGGVLVMFLILERRELCLLGLRLLSDRRCVWIICWCQLLSAKYVCFYIFSPFYLCPAVISSFPLLMARCAFIGSCLVLRVFSVFFSFFLFGAWSLGTTFLRGSQNLGPEMACEGWEEARIRIERLAHRRNNGLLGHGNSASGRMGRRPSFLDFESRRGGSRLSNQPHFLTDPVVPSDLPMHK
jgi:hypothetical protein